MRVNSYLPYIDLKVTYDDSRDFKRFVNNHSKKREGFSKDKKKGNRKWQKRK